MTTKVYKVGGDSTGIYENILALGKFAKSEFNSGDTVVFVVSAQATEEFRTTEALRKQFSGENKLSDIIKQHEDLASKCGINFNKQLLLQLIKQSRTLE